MKKMTPLMAAALGATALFAVQTASAQLQITEVMQQTSSGTASTINGDWWELTNFGPTPVNLLGYHWADTEDDLLGATPSPNFFPNFTLNPGQSVVIVDELSANEAAWRANWSLGTLEILSTDEMIDDADLDGDTFSGLSSSGDAVFFYNPSGVLLGSYSYTVGTRGVSFEIGSGNVDLGLSVAGENGAFRASNNDIGSPGVAVVPEPTALSLGLVGVLGLICRQRVVARR
jgi:hypothetical protein